MRWVGIAFLLLGSCSSSSGEQPDLALPAPAPDLSTVETPDLSASLDLAPAPDLAQPSDLESAPDLTLVDLEPPLDLTTIILATPPGAVWISSGGGPLQTANTQLNTCINGAIAPGSAIVGKSSATFGFFSSDTQ